MKPTSATMLITSFGRQVFSPRNGRTRSAILITAFVCCAVVMFLAGRISVSDQYELAGAISQLRHDIQEQQGAVDRLAQQNVLNVNALSARLAELQASSTRLDALGQRLAQMGQLSLEEFDFSEPVPVGGPVDDETAGSAREEELHQAIASLGDRLRRQSSQLDALQFLMMNRQLESDLTPTGWPVRKGWISSRYGERNDPFTGEREQHRGLDFAGTRGSEVLSVASGVVISAASRLGYGSTIEIDHGNGYQTRYAHNQELHVKAGDHVTAGQVIALMGETGRASAPHVHFEVLRNGTRINPAKFVGQLR